MSDEKVLTKEIAEQFLADEDSVDLSEFTAIEDDAANNLSKREGELDLDGLTCLSVIAATHLASSSGKLFLDSVTELDAETASALSCFSGECLTLNGITQLDDDVISALSQCTSPLHMRRWIMPPKLTSEAATLFSKLDDYDRPDFDEIHELDSDAARLLIENCPCLELPGLTSLSDATAEILSQHKGELLLGLTSLSDAAAEALGTHTGNLYLEQLTSISKPGADKLGKHQGGLHLNAPDVSGFKPLSPGEFPEAAELPIHVTIYNWLAICDDVDLVAQESIPLTVEQAKIIATFYPAHMPLWIDPWFAIPNAAVLQELARCKCLCFGISWPSITLDQARILSTFEARSIKLNTYPVHDNERQRCLLSLDAAEALSSFRGELTSSGPIAEPDSEVFSCLSERWTEFSDGGVFAEKVYSRCGLCATKKYVGEHERMEDAGDDFDARDSREHELASNGWKKHDSAGWICDSCADSWCVGADEE